MRRGSLIIPDQHQTPTGAKTSANQLPAKTRAKTRRLETKLMLCDTLSDIQFMCVNGNGKGFLGGKVRIVLK